MANTLGIQGFDAVEFYVGSAKMTAFWFAKALGFQIKAYSGPETGVKDRTSYFVTQNNIKIVLTSALGPDHHEILGRVSKHGDHVKRFSFQVENVEHAFHHAVKNGAFSIAPPSKFEDKYGVYEEALIRVYDDTELSFVNSSHYKGIYKPGFGKPLQEITLKSENPNLQFIDHIVGNVRENEMDTWTDYYNKTLDFETFIEFGPGDISTKFSALLSKVVRAKDDSIKIPINEPYEGLKKSQIEEFIDEYNGTGVQHIAIATPNIIESIKALRANGVEFLKVPDTYYDQLRKKNFPIKENIDELQEMGILCDTEGKGYLLQLFTKCISDRATFFFEIIQRCEGAEGFGQGNFQALFEAIEGDQERRGTWNK
jgi:4-hydroxyphenylpyruvate dioxygenase